MTAFIPFRVVMTHKVEAITLGPETAGPERSVVNGFPTARGANQITMHQVVVEGRVIG